MIKLFLRSALKVLLQIFTYFIPLLSSIRAVHLKDANGYNQWLTYFLLVFLINPIFTLLRVHDLFRLVIVIYLSLPKFQGALYIFDQILNVTLDKYDVENKVDAKILKVKLSIKAKLWNIAKDMGWSALLQIGEIVTFFQSQVMVSKKHEAETHLEDDLRKKKRDYTKTLAMKKETSSDSLADRKPSHSVAESLSSFASLEDLNTTEEKKMYVNDFTEMLRDGLYVFASYKHARQDSEEEENIFRLRIFFYEENINEDDGAYFVLHPVEIQNANPDDIDIIPLNQIKEVQASGTNVIEFILVSNENFQSSSLKDGAAMLLHTDSDLSLMHSVSMASVDSSIPEEAEVEDESRNSIKNSVSIVLSNSLDRDTLLHGLRASFFSKEQKAINGIEMSKSNGSESATSIGTVNEDAQVDSSNASKTMLNSSDKGTSSDEVMRKSQKCDLKPMLHETTRNNGSSPSLMQSETDDITMD